MTKKDNGIAQSNTNIFNDYSEILIGSKKYLIVRHFTGNRDLQQAIFTAVENEAKRAETVKQSA